ncbi:hypothetical protein [Actinoplanes sp. NPDC026670]|uniref:hypothetical protein n=1 Tax=Actinoplanes sp. NPDC026670 TaxID=3154700 RepID=UPI0033F96052
MNAQRIELPPFVSAPIVYPSLGRAIIDSSFTVGRSVLVGGLGLALLIGFAMLIAFGVATGAGALGFEAG